MKSRLSGSILFILILSLALQTITLPAFAQSEPNDSQAEIESLVIPQKREQSSYPDNRDAQPYPEEGFENMPPELVERYQRDSETIERSDAIPPSPEIIAKTREQVNSFTCTDHMDVPKIECEALVALYESTNGAAWKNSSNWLESTIVSTWAGVTVTVGSGVTWLSLGSNYLNGSIPTELGNLSNLENLWLHDNQLIGGIPAELGNLSKLEVLYLFENFLTGSIPTTLGNLFNLEILSLENNQLTGSIPAELGGLSNLWQLYLFNNQLTGNIPSSLGSLFNLWALHIDNNQFTGSIPAELGSLSNLWIMHLYNNQLTGSIPTSLGNLSGLWSLQLSNNLLTGNIPATLGNLSDLRALGLNQNQLSGSIPAALGNLSDLEDLGLSHNQLTGNIPEELGQLTNLHYLSLNDNSFEGEIPNTFVNLVNLCEGINEDYGCLATKSGLDLGYNRLNVPQEEPVESFLAIKDPDWNLTQAVNATIPGETGGTIQSNDGMTEIEVPAGAYTGEMAFLFIPQPSPEYPLGGLVQANNNFELIASVIGPTVSNSISPLTITINYTHQQIGPILENSLKLYHWDSAQSAWIDAISACPGGEYIRNPEENWLSLQLCELGEFALFGETQNINLPFIRR